MSVFFVASVDMTLGIVASNEFVFFTVGLCGHNMLGIFASYGYLFVIVGPC